MIFKNGCVTYICMYSLYYADITITFYPTEIHIRSDNFLRIIQPDDKNNVSVYTRMPDISQSLPFSFLPSIISYAIEDSLFEIGCENQIKVNLDMFLCMILSPYGVSASDSEIYV